MKKLRSAARFLVVVALVVVAFSISTMGSSPTQAATGGRVAFAYQFLPQNFDIALVNPDGTGLTRLGLAGLYNRPFVSAQDPVWSRDGRMIAFTGIRGLTLSAGQNLAYYDTVNKTYGYLTSPSSNWDILKAFSPDGKRLAYASFDEFNGVEVGVRSLDGKENTDVGRGYVIANGFDGISGFGIDWSPARSGAGAGLLVVPLAKQASVNGLYVSDTALYWVPPVSGGVGQVRQLTQPPATPLVTVQDLFPAFSPDGTKIAYARYTYDMRNLLYSTSSAQIRVINSDGSNDHAVSPLATGALKDWLGIGETAWNGLFFSHLTWSPDQGQILFDVSWTLDAEEVGIYRLVLPTSSSGLGTETPFAVPGFTAGSILTPSWGKTPTTGTTASLLTTATNRRGEISAESQAVRWRYSVPLMLEATSPLEEAEAKRAWPGPAEVKFQSVSLPVQKTGRVHRGPALTTFSTVGQAADRAAPGAL